jgi:hypothetical protein
MPMPVPAPTPLMLELCAGHALAMQCGARASKFLDRAAAARCWDERANLEAVRMAGLTARLMDGVQRLMLRRRDPAIDALSSSASIGFPQAAPRAGSPVPKHHAVPGQRRGCLKNGNPCGDYLQAPRCGARTRAGCPCRQPAMANGRCRLHGGLSTGPRTPAGLARSRAARLTHGYRTVELIGLRSRATHAARRLRSLNLALAAGHGVHRSDSIGCPRGQGSATVWSGAIDRRRPAGHGVDRSISTCAVGAAPSSGLIRGGRPLSATPTRKPAAHSRTPLRRVVVGPGMGSIAHIATYCDHRALLHEIPLTRVGRCSYNVHFRWRPTIGSIFDIVDH